MWLTNLTKCWQTANTLGQVPDVRNKLHLHMVSCIRSVRLGSRLHDITTRKLKATLQTGNYIIERAEDWMLAVADIRDSHSQGCRGVGIVPTPDILDQWIKVYRHH